jgi:hypothetical protein
MPYGTINHGRVLLYRHRHPIWFRFIEPIVSTVAFFVLVTAALLLIGATMGAGFLGLVWVALTMVA